jgi:hypothetical protein
MCVYISLDVPCSHNCTGNKRAQRKVAAVSQQPPRSSFFSVRMLLLDHIQPNIVQTCTAGRVGVYVPINKEPGATAASNNNHSLTDVTFCE